MSKVAERFEVYFSPSEEDETYRKEFSSADKLDVFVKRYFVEDEEAYAYEMN